MGPRLAQRGLGDELERFSLEQLASADVLVFGRFTYQGMAAYWPTASGEVAERMNSIAKQSSSRGCSPRQSGRTRR